MGTPVKNKGIEIHAWLDRLGVPFTGNEEMVKDYIDTRWPTLARHIRRDIFNAAARAATN